MLQIFLITFALVVSLLLQIKRKRNANAKENKEVDSEKRRFKSIPSLSIFKAYMWLLIFEKSRPLKFLLYVGKSYRLVQTSLFGRRALFINDLHLGKELFAKSVFSGRPSNALQTLCARGTYGINNNQGETWRVNRKFSFQNLREFGLNTGSMESHIQDEVEDLITTWKDKKGQTFCPQKAFYVPLLSSIWVILAGERASAKDKHLVQLVCNVYESVGNAAKIPSIFLWSLPFKYEFILHFINGIPVLPWIRRILNSIVELHNYLEELIMARKQSVKENGGAENLIEAYLKEMEGAKDPKSTFFGSKGELNLMAVIVDFFIAGGDTSANMLAWCMLHLIRNPQVQEKIYMEINTCVGEERRPLLSDRQSCPYTQAFIWEVLRYCPFSSTSLPHEILEDTCIGPYFVKKGTVVLLNIYSIHHDPKIWGDPENFRPERFLSNDGLSFVKHEAVCTFSVGQRRCPGEQLALDNLFLFVSAICQRFVLKPDPLLKNMPELRELKSLFNSPDVFYMTAVERLPITEKNQM